GRERFLLRSKLAATVRSSILAAYRTASGNPADHVAGGIAHVAGFPGQPAAARRGRALGCLRERMEAAGGAAGRSAIFADTADYPAAARVLAFSDLRAFRTGRQLTVL